MEALDMNGAVSNCSEPAVTESHPLELNDETTTTEPEVVCSATLPSVPLPQVPDCETSAPPSPLASSESPESPACIAECEGGAGAAVASLLPEALVVPQSDGALEASCVPQSVRELSITVGTKSPTVSVDLRDVEQKLRSLGDTDSSETVLHRYLAIDSVSLAKVPNATHVDPLLRNSLLQAAHNIDAHRRVPNQQIFRRKLVLLGYQEVGKTSLRKCFESEPLFMRNLPDVKTTTGVEVQSKNINVSGDAVQLMLSDFAGQEAYHSHTLFLTDRSIFILVWKISAIEQDFQSGGISSNEEERLYNWIAEVYAKFPRAKIALIATHLDELRVQGQRSVEMILMKVEGKIKTFMNRIAVTDPVTGAKITNEIVGNFAVSCKTRNVIATGGLRHLSGQRISALLRFFAEVAHRDCMGDRDFPSGAIPGRHVRLIDEVAAKKSRYPHKLMVPLGEFVHSAIGFGVESDAELLQIALLMHSWNMIYLFNPHRLADNVFIMLHPLWLGRLAAALFSYAHIMRTPLHLRSIIGGLEYTVSHAEAADMHLMRKGFLRIPLARILFRRPLRSALGCEPDDSDFAMALQLLAALGLIVPVEVPCDEPALIAEETFAGSYEDHSAVHPTKITRYYIPSISPSRAPTILKKIAPVLFNRGAKVRFGFNLLPDEMWWRIQVQLQHLQQVVVVHKPHGLRASETNALTYADADADVVDEYCLQEADEEHNRWSDAMWLRGESCRVFLYRDGLHGIRIFSTETRPGGAEEVLEVVERAVSDLLDEYHGIHREVHVACPEPNCEGWILASVVATDVRVTCPACHQSVSTADIVASGVGPRGPRQFSDELLTETGELLYLSLDCAGCEQLCKYLGVPYRDPKAGKGATPTSPMVHHMDYMYALDKVVRAALMRDLRERVEEEARRRRMFEVSGYY